MLILVEGKPGERDALEAKRKKEVFPRGSDSGDVCCFCGGIVSLAAQTVKNLPAKPGGPGSTPGSGRSSGEGNGNPLQYFRLGNPMDRGSWQADVHGIPKSQT